jgi:hypothetical protein
MQPDLASTDLRKNPYPRQVVGPSIVIAGWDGRFPVSPNTAEEATYGSNKLFNLN